MNGGILWLIDGAYVFKGAKSTDYYLDLRRELQEWSGGRFYKIIFFNSVKGDRQQYFHKWLYKQGFEVSLYDVKEMTVKCPCCKTKFGREVQAGVDVGICTAVLTEKYSRLVLTAGDGDFIDALKVAKEGGVCQRVSRQHLRQAARGGRQNKNFNNMMSDLFFTCVVLFVIYWLWTKTQTYCPGCGKRHVKHALRYEYDRSSHKCYSSRWGNGCKTRTELLSFSKTFGFYKCDCGKEFKEYVSFSPLAAEATGKEFPAKKCKGCSGQGKLRGKTKADYQWDYSSSEYKWVDSQKVKIKCGRCGGKGWLHKKIK